MHRDRDQRGTVREDAALNCDQRLPAAELKAKVAVGEYREDRMRRVLRELPRGEHTTGSIAKAAGVKHAKTLRRLHQLAASG